MIIRIRIDDGQARANREQLLQIIHGVQDLGGRVEYMADKFRDCFCFNCANATQDELCNADFPIFCDELCVPVALCGACKNWKSRADAEKEVIDDARR